MRHTHLQSWILDVRQEILHLLRLRDGLTHQLQLRVGLLVSLDIVLKGRVTSMSSELGRTELRICLRLKSHVSALTFTLLLEGKHRTATILLDIEVLDESPTRPIRNVTLKLRIISFVIYRVVLTFKHGIVHQMVG